MDLQILGNSIFLFIETILYDAQYCKRNKNTVPAGLPIHISHSNTFSLSTTSVI
jgi:hypothetical protein